MLDPLLTIVRQSHPKADLSIIERAYDVAEQKHQGQRRKSGDPYITHPVAVATILAELGMTTQTLVAALADVGEAVDAVSRKGIAVMTLVSDLPHVTSAATNETILISGISVVANDGTTTLNGGDARIHILKTSSGKSHSIPMSRNSSSNLRTSIRLRRSPMFTPEF